MGQQQFLFKKSRKIITAIILGMVGMGSLVSAQETNVHPLFGTTGFDHYPHFSKSYHYGDLQFRKKQSQASMDKYGKNKGRLLGTLLGAVAGGLMDNDPISAKGMVLGGMTGGIIGQTIVEDPAAPMVVQHQISLRPVSLKSFQQDDAKLKTNLLNLSADERQKLLRTTDEIIRAQAANKRD